MDNFRVKAIDVMGQNNALIRDPLQRERTGHGLRAACPAACPPRLRASAPL